MKSIPDSSQASPEYPPVGYCQCGCGRKSPPAKYTSPKRGLVKGQPTHYIKGHATWGNPLPRFEALIDKSGGSDACWPWRGCTNDSGYGQFYYQGHTHRAHRLAYSVMVGPIPTGMVVRHKCDFILCCNPSHLELGTQGENVQDMIGRGRRRPDSPLAHAKLTPETAAEIRRLVDAGIKRRTLADRYGVSLATIHDVIAGRHWKDVPLPPHP